MTSINKKIPTLATTLDRLSTYPTCIRSIETYSDIIEIPKSEFRVWHVVTEDSTKPSLASGKDTSSGRTTTKRIQRTWKDADAIAQRTREQNCARDVQARIGNCTTASQSYQELKKAFERQTTTEFGALLDSFSSILHDDRKISVDEHIVEYDRTWNTVVGMISRVDTSSDDGFGKDLQEFTQSDKAKTEFLLRSLPPFYWNTIENIKSKEPANDDAIRKLREYVPIRQKGRRITGKEVSQENPVVLKTDKKITKENGKRCDYCIGKGWKGLNHLESECYTKKRQEGKKEGKTSKVKTEKKESDDEGASICHIIIKLASNHVCENQGKFQYDTATSHHTTNNKALLQNIRTVNMAVPAPDNTVSMWDTIGRVV